MTLQIILAALAGLAGGAILVYALLSRRLGVAQAELAAQAGQLQAQAGERATERNEARAAQGQLQHELRAAQEQAGRLEGDLRVARERVDEATRRLAEQKQWVEAQAEAMEARVKATTEQLLKHTAREFAETNKRELGVVVDPFKEHLAAFRARVDEVHTQEVRDRSSLKEQIVQLTSLNQAVSREANQLTRALTISSKSTGDWGEAILRGILESSGLRAGREFELQHGITGADGRQRILDALIRLPDDRQVVVDAKVSNKAWTEYCAATDDEARARHLKDHLDSLRAHMRGLSAKDYAAAPGLNTVEFVLMFVPVEGALLTALQHECGLYEEAYRGKVILVVPSTLMAVLKLIEGMWGYQRRKESADKIAEAGRSLYDKLTVFAGTFLEVGRGIEKANEAFEKARGQLSTGKGNALRTAEKLKSMGVGSGKSMPAGLLGQGGDDDEEEATGDPQA